MDYNIENKGFVCFVYNLQRRRAFWAALLVVLAVKFILCELFLGGAVADALVVKLRFATLFSAFGAKPFVGFIWARAGTAWHTGPLSGTLSPF